MFNVCSSQIHSMGTLALFLSVTVLNSNEEFKMMHLHHLSRFEVLWDEFNKLNRPFSCRDEIVRAVCPQLHGMYFVKLCLLLTIIGGSAHGSGDASTLSTNSSAASGVSRRSQSHLLIVGVRKCSIFAARHLPFIQFFCRILVPARVNCSDLQHRYFLGRC